MTTERKAEAFGADEPIGLIFGKQIDGWEIGNVVVATDGLVVIYARTAPQPDDNPGSIGGITLRDYNGVTWRAVHDPGNPSNTAKVRLEAVKGKGCDDLERDNAMMLEALTQIADTAEAGGTFLEYCARIGVELGPSLSEAYEAIAKFTLKCIANFNAPQNGSPKPDQDMNND